MQRSVVTADSFANNYAVSPLQRYVVANFITHHAAGTSHALAPEKKQVTDLLLRGGTAFASKREEAQIAGSAPRQFGSVTVRLAAILWASQRIAFQFLMSSLATNAARGLYRLRTFFEVDQHDETPAKQRVKEKHCTPALPASASSDAQLQLAAPVQHVDLAMDAGKASVAIAKVVASRVRFACLVEQPEDMQEPLMYFEGEMPNFMQTIERNTGECGCAASADAAIPLQIGHAKLFDKRVRLTSADRAASNYRGEAALMMSRPAATEDDGWGGGHVDCEIHVQNGGTGRMLKLYTPHISGMIHFALSFQDTGAWGRFRTKLGDVAIMGITIYSNCECPADATAHRHRTWDLFVPQRNGPEGVYSSKRRFILEAISNGDLRRLGGLEHYCCVGCCMSPQHTAFKVRRYWVPALAPHQVKPISRKDWAGTDKPAKGHRIVAECQRYWATSVHGLLLQTRDCRDAAAWRRCTRCLSAASRPSSDRGPTSGAGGRPIGPPCWG